MAKRSFKIGFSDIGGIFIGKNIQSDFHKHYAVTVIISFGETFSIKLAGHNEDVYSAALVQKNVSYSLKSGNTDYLAFIHIVPYTSEGLKLSDSQCAVRVLDIADFDSVVGQIKDWFYQEGNDPQKIKELLHAVSSIPLSNCDHIDIDSRVMESFQLIMQSEAEKLSVNDVAPQVCLSVSHFNRLFKKETGLTFRKFVLHSKLIKSIFAMYEQNSLTQAAFIGGFADQPHLTRTFKDNFGIKPSTSLK
ncbi:MULTISPECIES: AraC family transcriptional regulator [unclassified Imperialibacter]|uniref:helix-turn-helix domain-containing protein n=1 Tax=unclassified Imperialibacter TaxID=2629706 RepID=UPI001252F029|nr:MULTISPECIES: AraC family transcriptional regulator [unclassified Imperialibacter]CAD5257849.1 putative AraC-like DNA-binding protein [Imperialibacter sp. 75]CAD5260853.1 putative AraC-like DNA-binding protein [Imperialibacter sp. 89]VVT25285.1 putative Helix-turn-helix domain-containing protein [Imperialibacter sp. EC-SDR9]